RGEVQGAGRVAFFAGQGGRVGLAWPGEGRSRLRKAHSQPVVGGSVQFNRILSGVPRRRPSRKGYGRRRRGTPDRILNVRRERPRKEAVKPLKNQRFGLHVCPGGLVGFAELQRRRCTRERNAPTGVPRSSGENAHAGQRACYAAASRAT